MAGNRTSGSGIGGAVLLHGTVQNRTFNSCQFVSNTAEYGGGITLTVDGAAVITNCNFQYNVARTAGGGLCVDTGDTVCQNCTFEDNEAAKHGGAIAVIDGPTLVLRQTSGGSGSISYNSAGDGGAISVVGYAQCIVDAPQQIWIDNNTATNNGGAIHVDGGRLAIVGYCDLTRNDATNNGGAVFLTNGASMVVVATNRPSYRQVQFRANQAGRNGGAVFATDADTHASIGDAKFTVFGGVGNRAMTGGGGGIAAFNNASVTTVNCQIENNAAQLQGGGVYLSGGNGWILGQPTSGYVGTMPVSIIRGNAATNTSSSAGGAVSARNGSYLSLAGTLVVSNRGSFGGGSYVAQSTATVVNSVYVRNVGDTAHGGAHYNEAGAWVRMLHCTMAHNSSEGVQGSGVGRVLVLTNCIVWGHSGAELPPAALVNYSDIDGGFGTGTGNINADPQFTATNSLDYRIAMSSSCTNTGSAAGITTDCVGNPRPFGGGVDMGAYEAVPEPVAAVAFVVVACLRAIGRRRNVRQV